VISCKPFFAPFFEVNDVGHYFCPDFQRFCPDFQYFVWIFRDFAQIFSFVSRIFDKSKPLGVRFHPYTPASYTIVHDLPCLCR